jgi:LacI family transcriptional regulator
MTTLRDVAKATGFSVTTVSRALRGFDDVTAETRRLIEVVARELDYRPNQIARKLVSGRSGMVGLVLEAPPQPFEHGHFFELIASLSQAFSARDLDFVLRIGDGTSALPTHERLINRGALDGFILTLPVLDDPRIGLMLARNVAFVVHGHQVGDDRYAFFDTDNRLASALAVELLAGLGHRRIALVAGPPRWPSVAERVRGFRAAMAARGLPFDAGLVTHGDTSTAYGAEVAARLLARPERPTAIVCCNSLVAAGVYEVARARGLAIPADLSVVAHDDALPQVATDRLEPALSVTRLPLRAAGEPLADLLVRRIAGEPVASLQVTQAPELIVRESTAPPA